MCASKRMKDLLCNNNLSFYNEGISILSSVKDENIIEVQRLVDSIKNKINE